MSWQNWPQAPVAANLGPGIVNSAPTVVTPAMQYSPEQWAQMQHQNWQQWAQWQQQYQQWHQQYGAEYQKSMGALGAQPPLPAVPTIGVPPPLPVEPKPPLPPEDPPSDQHGPNFYASAPPPKPNVGYTTGTPNVQGNYQRANWNQNKRPYGYQNNDYDNSKRYMTEKPNNWNQNQWNKPDLTQAPPNFPPPENQHHPPTQSFSQPPPTKPNTEELTEAEKKFDKEFAAWEEQFNKWKEQNANHPDKNQYREYEKKWESWRNSLLERREQMRRKRLGITAPKNVSGGSQSNQNQSNKPLTDQPSISDNFTKPPPTLNNEPLKFNFPGSFTDGPEDSGEGFLKGTATGGIPGLDLVKDDAPLDDDPIDKDNIIDLDKDERRIDGSKQDDRKEPDFEAISKGINNILGDEKLMSMLSMVTKNQTPVSSNPITTTITKPQGDIQDHQQINDHSSQGFDDRSNQGDYYNQREVVNNFDDQTRSSFTMGPNESDGGRYDRRFDQNFQNFRPNSGGRFNNGSDQNNFSGSFNQRNINNMVDKGNFGRNMGGSGDFANNKGMGNFTRNDNFNQGNNFNCGDNFNSDNFNRGVNFNRNSFNRGDNFNPNRNFNRNENYQEGEYYNEQNYDDYDNYNEAEDYESYHKKFTENEYDNNLNQDVKDPVKDDKSEPKLVSETDTIFEPAKVIDYDHKSIKKNDLDIILEPMRMFDYRHKPLNRIPLPQRPEWLSKTVRFIPEFDPIAIPYERSFIHPRHPQDMLPPRGRPFRDVTRWPQWDNRYDDRGRVRSREFEGRKMERDKFDRKNSRSPSPRVGKVKKDFEVDRKPMDFEELSDDDMDWDDDKLDNDKPSDKNVGQSITQLDKAPVGKNMSGNYNVKTTMIEDLICQPGRYSRPPKIVIILRGPPGSGKTYLAKLIKDKEVENGGSAPRILSLDDYFMVEQEKEVVEDGRTTKVKEMVYEYEKEMESSYRASLIKSFKKTITDGYFPFIIVDNVNEKVKYFGEMWSFAKQNGFQVYICQLDLDPQVCAARNIHGRTEREIEDCVAAWEPAPSHHPLLDASGLLSAAPIQEVEMEVVGVAEENVEEEGVQDHVRSKWDNFDCSINNLAKLDGVSKPLRPSRTMEEYLQLEDEQWSPPRSTKPGQKRVRWADLEHQKQQAKMKALGFVVGQNWDKVMNSTGESALTQTKYIERVNQF